MALVNSFAYNLRNGKKMKTKDFRKKVMDGLLEGYSLSPEAQPGAANFLHHRYLPF